MEVIIGGLIFIAAVAAAVIFIKRRDRNDVSTGESSSESNRTKGPTQFPK